MVVGKSGFVMKEELYESCVYVVHFIMSYSFLFFDLLHAPVTFSFISSGLRTTHSSVAGIPLCSASNDVTFSSGVLVTSTTCWLRFDVLFNSCSQL